MDRAAIPGAMRAAAFTDLTGPDGVELIERPVPEPGPGEAVVDVAACAINRHDLWLLEGDSAMVAADDLAPAAGQRSTFPTCFSATSGSSASSS